MSRRMSRGTLSAAMLAAIILVAGTGVLGQEPPPLTLSSKDVVPLLRPAGAGAGFYVLPLLQAEAAFQAGQAEEALPRFLEIAYNAPDDERKGFVWMRVGELLLARGDAQEALSAADKAISLSRARYLVLSAMDLKFRVYHRLQWRNEARQLAAYLLDQKFIGADAPKLLAVMARSDAEEGRGARAVASFHQAIAAAKSPEEAAALKAERDSFVDGMTDLPALREAAETEDDAEVRAHLFFTFGRVAARNGFVGMAAYALERAARANGLRGREAAEQLYRLEKIIATRPKIAGLVPLSGKLADLGFAVLSGAEVALRQVRRGESDALSPVVRWIDTGGQPERARKEFLSAAADRSVIGVLGPVTGDEGRSVSAAFGPMSPPVLYLGQKAILEKPFLYAFGLSPVQEARAVLSYLGRNGRNDLLLFHPENGYGEGFAEAVSVAARETGVRIARTVSYPTDMRDFTGIIKKAVGNRAFSRRPRGTEKGKELKLPLGGILIADRWDRVFLIASQLRYYNVYLPLAGFSGWNDDELIRKGKDSVAGAVFSVDYADAVPGTQGEKFRRNFRDAMRLSPSRFEAMGYDGALFLSDAFALDTGKEYKVNGEASREKIPRLKTYLGVTGLFQFGPAGEMRRKAPLLRVELGNFVPVPDF